MALNNYPDLKKDLQHKMEAYRDSIIGPEESKKRDDEWP